MWFCGLVVKAPNSIFPSVCCCPSAWSTAEVSCKRDAHCLHVLGTSGDPVPIDRNGGKNFLKNYMKDKRMETFRGSQGKHCGCVLTRSLTLGVTSHARLGGYVKCSVRLRLGERPLRRLSSGCCASSKACVCWTLLQSSRKLH